MNVDTVTSTFIDQKKKKLAQKLRVAYKSSITDEHKFIQSNNTLRNNKKWSYLL